jgi:hypothetical protein
MIMQNRTEEKLRQVLRDLIRLLDAAEKCDLCCGPSVAFDPDCTGFHGGHAKQWKLLRARIQVLLKQDVNKPN